MNAPKNNRMTSLKCCPFCGGRAAFRSIRSGFCNSGVGFEFMVSCTKCKLKSPKSFSLDLRLNEAGGIETTIDERYDAVKLWNARISE